MTKAGTLPRVGGTEHTAARRKRWIRTERIFAYLDVTSTTP